MQGAALVTAHARTAYFVLVQVAWLLRVCLQEGVGVLRGSLGVAGGL